MGLTFPTTKLQSPPLVFLKFFQDGSNVKFCLDTERENILFLRKGKLKPIRELPGNIKDFLINKLLEDTGLLRQLKNYPDVEILEKFTYYYISGFKNNVMPCEYDR
ncbi:hypothetical protein [Abyssalbus ytuae]|uniref:Uncharacterized protein n=1 Tax=Abyssalbus ytuae TaxID=2926907 RepID=A0A9E6ZM45_9FLAO|nr:hypothetical protein [Abyssalbus ytuae]UOB16805.1 hypothetical protein MQE35_13800 [Abyssalbus ytuae]